MVEARGERSVPLSRNVKCPFGREARFAGEVSLRDDSGTLHFTLRQRRNTSLARQGILHLRREAQTSLKNVESTDVLTLIHYYSSSLFCSIISYFCNENRITVAIHGFFVIMKSAMIGEDNMLITGEIRDLQWYDFDGPLKPKDMKLFDEYFALAILRYCFPEKYNSYAKIDSPDLQSNDRRCGVEVTLATSESLASIEGDHVKYRQTNDLEKKNKLRSKIENAGARVDSIGLSYPVETGQQDKEKIKKVIQKKLRKLDLYRKNGFEELELFIRFSGMPAILDKESYIELFSAAKGFNTVYFTAYSCLMFYKHSENKLESRPIPREDYSALQAIARLTVDGKIKNDSSIWTET